MTTDNVASRRSAAGFPAATSSGDTDSRHSGRTPAAARSASSRCAAESGQGWCRRSRRCERKLPTWPMLFCAHSGAAPPSTTSIVSQTALHRAVTMFPGPAGEQDFAKPQRGGFA